MTRKEFQNIMNMYSSLISSDADAYDALCFVRELLVCEHWRTKLRRPADRAAISALEKCFRNVRRLANDVYLNSYYLEEE